MFFYFIVFLQPAPFGLRGTFVDVVSQRSRVSYSDDPGCESLRLEGLRLTENSGAGPGER